MNGTKIKTTIAIVCLCLVVAYALYQARYVLIGPRITISSPENGAVFEEPLITITGVVRNTASFFINGESVFPEQNGSFTHLLLLPPGHTIIETRAQDKFGRVRTKTIEALFVGTTTTDNASGTTTPDKQPER